MVPTESTGIDQLGRDILLHSVIEVSDLGIAEVRAFQLAYIKSYSVFRRSK